MQLLGFSSEAVAVSLEVDWLRALFPSFLNVWSSAHPACLEDAV